MANTIVKVIWRSGKISSCAPQLFPCTIDVKPGHVVPVDDCCDDETVWKLNYSSSPSTNPNARYGVVVTINGETMLLDVMSASNETASTPMTGAILLAKVSKYSDTCACTDCTSATPTPTITGVYNGTYPAITSTSKCYNIVVSQAPTDANINSFNRRYLGRIENAIVTAVTATSFTVKASATGTSLAPVLASVDTVTATTC
jgi:hypothetical protein